MIALTNSLMTSMPNEKASAYHSIQLKHRDRLVFHKVGIITKNHITMKKIIFVAFLFVSVIASAQNIKNDGEPYEVYCALQGESQLFGKFKLKRFIWGEEKDEINLTDEKGKR